MGIRNGSASAPPGDAAHVGSGQDYKAPDYWAHEIQLVIKIYEEHSQVHQRRASSRPPSVAQRPMLRPRPPPTVRLPACAPRR
jgi:hypothetical protein